MFVFNLRLNKSKIFKCILVLFICIIIGFLAISLISFFGNIEITKTENEEITDFIPTKDVAKIEDKNLTNILDTVHKNIDNYVGQKVSYIGYVYRVNGFNDNYFVLARDMIIKDDQYLIVGFLCDLSDINYQIQDGMWLEATGEITKYDYNGQYIPKLNLINVVECQKPENDKVPMPRENFIETSNIY